MAFPRLFPEIRTLEHGRAWVLVAFSFIFWIGGTLSAVSVLSSFNEAPVIITTTLFLPSLMLLAPLIYYTTNNMPLAAKAFLLAVYGNILFVLITVGGLLAPSSFYLILLPLLAGLLLGRWWSLAACTIVIATYIAFYLLRHEVGPPIHRLDPDVWAHSAMGSLIITAAATMLATIVFHAVNQITTVKLAKASQQALAANEAKTRFLANMSHEIRTPMNGITGMLSLVMEKNPPPEIRDRVQIALESSHALMHILDDVLDFSKLEAGRISLDIAPFSPRKEIEDVIFLHEAQAQEKKLRLIRETTIPKDLLLSGDAARIRQVVLNLLSNALKYTDTGAVTVRMAAKPSGQGQCLLTIEVADTGPGISADDQERLFKRFERVGDPERESRSGSGLGLAISKQMIDVMGGRLTVESAPGQGATFRAEIDLPVAESLAPQRSAEPGGWESSLSGLKVLVAEDDRTNQVVARSILETLDCRVSLVENGLDAIGAVQGEDFDLVLMDIQMPVMDGQKAFERIRAMGGGFAHLPVIAVTAQAMPGDRERFLAKGMTGYISKPFEASALVSEIRAALARAPVTPMRREKPPRPAIGF